MVVSKKRNPKAESAPVQRLKRENKKLRTLIDGVWAALSAVDGVSSVRELREAIFRATDEIVNALPSNYAYEETSTKEGEARAEAALNDAVLSTYDAKQLGSVIVAGQEGVNGWLPIYRYILVDKHGGGSPHSSGDTLFDIMTLANGDNSVAPPWSEMSDDEYKQMARTHFGLMVLAAARVPCTLRAEMARYIAVLQELQSGYPKLGKRTADPVIQALEMKKLGAPWSRIYRTVLGPDSSGEDQKALSANVRAHISNERRRLPTK
jgi:hypothetical protein